MSNAAVVTNNTFSNNAPSPNAGFYGGMIFFYSSNYNLKDNTFTEEGIVLLGDALENWNTHSIDTSNNVNGKPIQYWKNITGGTVPNGRGQVILANCTDIIVENQILDNCSFGINIGYSINITVVNNTVSDNWYGISTTFCNKPVINNNTVSDCDYGVYIQNTNNCTLLDNNLVRAGVGLYGNQINNWNTHEIDTSNIVNNKPVYYYKNSNGSTIPSGAGQVILANCTNVIIKNQSINNGSDGLQLGFSSNNTIVDNSLHGNRGAGVILYKSSDNKIKFNTITNGFYGIYIDWEHCTYNLLVNNLIINNRFGLYITGDNNKIYHNNIIDNVFQVAQAGINNQWDDGYPSGGNYWSDYNGIDLYSSPSQNTLGSDGIGDTPYINGLDQHNYPLMAPMEYSEINVTLEQGWNLLSLPVRQLNNSIGTVLESIIGKYDYIQTYDANDPDSWKTYATFKPPSLNDLDSMNHLRAYWINITEPNVTIKIKGDEFGSTLALPLYAGWNLVGYPSLNDTMTVANALWGTGADRVEKFDAIAPYRISEVGPTYIMKPGEGYWIHVPADAIWTIDW